MKTVDYSPAHERLFKESGPFFHVCSKPVADVIFRDTKEKQLAVLYLALAARESNTSILAYIMMSNHFHVVLRSFDARLFYDRFVSLINNYLRRHGRKDSLLPEKPTIVPINTIAQLRDVIAYVLRNQYVVDPAANPFTCKWSSGYLYFNPQLDTMIALLPYTKSENLSKRRAMSLSCTAEGILPPGLLFLNDDVAPSSFVDYKLVEKLFLNARQFAQKMIKNVEAQVEVATSIGEEFILPDDDLFGIAWKYSKNTWGVDKIRQLDSVQKRELAKYLKLTYHSSNGQLIRITGLAKTDIDAMFPLSAK